MNERLVYRVITEKEERGVGKFIFRKKMVFLKQYSTQEPPDFSYSQVAEFENLKDGDYELLLVPQKGNSVISGFGVQFAPFTIK